METCFTNRPRFESIASSTRRSPSMHRWCAALALALILVAGYGCSNNRQAERVLALQEYYDKIEDSWQNDISIERDKIDDQIDGIREKAASLAETVTKTERWKTERAQPALDDLKVAADTTARLMRDAPASGSVISFIEDKSKTDRDSLSRRIDETASRLNKSDVETADRLDSLGRELAKSARSRSDLEKEIAATSRQLRSERRTAVDELRREIPDTEALDAPVGKLLDDWRRSGRLASIETRERYLWPVVFGIVALALVNMVIALRPRHSKQAADALSKAKAAEFAADSAMSVARRAQDTAESIREEDDSLRRTRTRKTRRSKESPKTRDTKQTKSVVGEPPPAHVDPDRRPIDPIG